MRLNVLLSILAIVITVAACGTPRLTRAVDPARWTKVVPLEEAPTTRREARAALDLDEAQGRLNAAELELDAARAQVKQAHASEEAARREAILAPLRRVAAITAATCLVGLLASVALWFILPIGTKRMAVIGGTSSLAVLVVAVAFHAALPYLALLGGALVVVGVGWLLWRLKHTQEAVRVVATNFDRVEDALHAFKLGTPEQINDLLSAVKATAARAQDNAGVRKLIAGVRQKAIPPLPVPDLAPTPAG